MKNIILKIFSYKGEFTRKEYLLFGLLVPIVGLFLVVLGTQLINPEEGTLFKSILGFLIFIPITVLLSSAIKRARDTSASVVLIMILFFTITPAAIIYLIFASQKGDNTNKGSKKFGMIIGVVFLVGVLGSLAIVTVSKLAETKQSAEINK